MFFVQYLCSGAGRMKIALHCLKNFSVRLCKETVNRKHELYSYSAVSGSAPNTHVILSTYRPENSVAACKYAYDHAD